jgi:transposase
MQHDTATTTYGGVDWATDSNQACVIDADGRTLRRLNTAHDGAGIRRLVDELVAHSVAQVAIERPDGPVVKALLAAGLEVVVIPPRQVKHLRSRYGSAGNKDDRFDAFVLADTLRTDAHRRVPLRPDTTQTLALRSAVRARSDLVDARVALCNQLRAHLRVVFPAVVGLFADLDSSISLAFLTRFPSVDKAAWLGHRRLGAWLAANAYCGRVPTATLLARLHDGPQGTYGDAAAGAAHTTGAYVETLKALRVRIAALDAQIREQLALHPDAHIFQSLPHAGIRPRRQAARRDRRRPRPLPHRSRPVQPRRRMSLHTPVRPPARGHLPLGVQQEAARSRHGLRRRQPPRQPPGRRDLRPTPRRRQDPPARHPHPRQSPAARHLTLLARRNRLRPGPPPRRQERSYRRCLTQGYSCDVSLCQALGGQHALPPDSVANGSFLMLNAAEFWLSTIVQTWRVPSSVPVPPRQGEANLLVAAELGTLVDERS